MNVNSTEDMKNSSFDECDPSTKNGNRDMTAHIMSNIDREAESGTAGTNSLWGVFHLKAVIV